VAKLRSTVAGGEVRTPDDLAVLGVLAAALLTAAGWSAATCEAARAPGKPAAPTALRMSAGVMAAGPAAFFLAIPFCLWTAKFLAG
jgi:hypothetical protein